MGNFHGTNVSNYSHLMCSEDLRMRRSSLAPEDLRDSCLNHEEDEPLLSPMFRRRLTENHILNCSLPNITPCFSRKDSGGAYESTAPSIFSQDLRANLTVSSQSRGIKKAPKKTTPTSHFIRKSSRVRTPKIRDDSLDSEKEGPPSSCSSS